jgi:hypothetical protein
MFSTMFSSMSGFRWMALLTLAAGALPLALADGPDAYPKPSPVPVSWELKFTHSDPRRIVVKLPGEAVPRAYWYFSYSVVNTSDIPGEPATERVFYPVFVMRTEDGSLINGNDGVHPAVFDAINAAEKNKFLEEPTLMGGKILLGEDQRRDSIAVWPEPSQRLGGFAIFASGMWGETAPANDAQGNTLKDAKGNDVMLHKTLMMTYHVDGDETHFDRVRNTGEEFIMR